MKVGYFKVDPPAVATKRGLTPYRHNLRSLIVPPLTGLILGVVFLGSIQFGMKVNDYNLPKERYQSVASITLPANVSFAVSVYDIVSNLAGDALCWSQDTWASFIANWRVFLGLEVASVLSTPQSISDISAELREQIRQDILVELRLEQGGDPIFGGAVPADKPVYAVTAVPSTGSTTLDKDIQQNLYKVFADQTDVNFDSSGTSGIVTPIFQDGRRGDPYVFVLTPAH